MIDHRVRKQTPLAFTNSPMINPIDFESIRGLSFIFGRQLDDAPTLWVPFGTEVHDYNGSLNLGRSEGYWRAYRSFLWYILTTRRYVNPLSSFCNSSPWLQWFFQFLISEGFWIAFQTHSQILTYTHTYIYIYKERERERERESIIKFKER